MTELSDTVLMAVKKSLSRMTIEELERRMTAVDYLIRAIGKRRRKRESLANRTMRVVKRVDGSEIWPHGPLFQNLVIDMTSPELNEVMTVVKSKHVELLEREQLWLETEKADHDKKSPGKKFKPVSFPFRKDPNRPRDSSTSKNRNTSRSHT